MAAAAPVKDDSKPWKRTSSYDLLPPNMSELRVVLLGNSCSGRSSVGNFILRETAFNTKEEAVCCQRVSGRCKWKETVLINTPDLLHPNISEDKLTELIENCVSLSAPGPHVFLLVLQPEDFTEEHRLKLQTVLENFGDRSFEHSLVLITTPREESPGSSEKYEQHPPLKHMIKMCRFRSLRQKNLELLQLLTRLGEIVRVNNGEHVSCDLSDSVAAGIHQNLDPQSSVPVNWNPARNVARGLRIVLFGKREEEMTTLCNFIMTEKSFNFQRFCPITQCEAASGEWRGRPLTVVKAPDMFSLSVEAVIEEVKKCETLCSPGPNVLLLLVKPSDFTEENRRTLKFILSLFGPDAFKHSMVVTTYCHHWNETSVSVNKLLRDCGGRLHNMFEDKHQLLMEKIENIVRENKETFLTFSEEPEHMKPALNLVLCGRRGAGKTSAAEAILGQTELHSVSSSSECVKHQGEVRGRQVSLVELPALSGKPQEEVMKESFRCISLCDPEGVHAFILVLPVGPLTDEDKGELETIQNSFSSPVNDFTMILFTVESDPAAPAVVDFLKRDRDIQELLQSCGGRSVVLNIKDKQQISELLKTVDKMRLSKDKPHCYTTETFAHCKMDEILQLKKNINTLQAELKDLKTKSTVTDAEKFFTVSQTSSKMQKQGLTARPLEAAKSVRVERLHPTVVKDMLDLYFEKNWTLPDKIVMIQNEQAAIVTFSDPKVVENICIKTDYMIGSTPVKMYPYHESLGTALYGKERPTWKMPDPVTEGVHHTVWKFLLMKKQLKSINDQMRPYFCSVDLDNPEVKLSPLPNFLRQKDLTAKHVENWAGTAQEAFRKLMSHYTAFECPANVPAWKAAEKEVRSVVKEDAYLVLDAPKGALMVAGRADHIKQIKAPVENLVLKAMSQIERQRNGVSEVMSLSPAMFYILKQDGLQNAALNISADMNLSYDEGAQKLTISGLRAEVFQAKAWILERNVHMSKKQLNIPTGLLDFLKAVDPMDMSQDLFTSQGISAIYSIDNKGVLLLGSSDSILAEAESRMKMVLDVNTLDVEDQEVLKLHNWVDLNQQLLDAYNFSKKKNVDIQIHPERRDKITVAGFKTPVKEVSYILKEFIVNYSQVKETVRVESCAVVQFIEKKKSHDWFSIAKANGVTVDFDQERPRFIIAGARLHVQKAKSCFQELTSTLFTDNFIVDKPGAKKYFQSYGSMFLSTIMAEFSCVVVLCPENQEDDEEEENYEEESGLCYCKVKTTTGVLVSVSKADICSFSVDAVVNSASEELQHIGGLALALLKAAGPQLQKISNDYISKHGKLRPGDAIVTDACNLPCKYVVHAVGPRFSDSDKKTSVSRLKLAVKESLKQAEMVNCSTIALPAISSGVFGFPVDLCAETIAQAVREYCDSPRGPGSLTQIHLVDNNNNTVGVLAKAVNQEFIDLGPTMTAPEQAAGAWASGGHQRGRGRGGGRGGGRGAEFHGGQQGNRGGHSPRGHTRPGGHGGPGRMEQTTAEGLKIVFRKGNIQRTDVIVNTMSENMNLTQGAVSNAIRRAARPRLQNTVTSFFTGLMEERPSTDGLVLEGEEFESTEFQLCADNKKAVTEAKKRIEQLIVAEQAKRTITDPLISHLSQADVEQLRALQRELTVSIRLDKGLEDQEPSIHLEGLTRDVFTAESAVSNIIRRVERTENLKTKALMLSALVEWQFQHSSGMMVPFDMNTNLTLEEALEKKEKVKIKINNETYFAHVLFGKAVSEDGRREVELLRKDLKDDTALPGHWDDMKGDLVKLFPLTAGSKEYSDVETELTKTGLTPNIISIERVQNKTLWQSYQLMKKQLEVKNKHTNNEKLLFHGTGANSIDLINNQGFNRSYAGAHGAMYGNGSYFAVDPAYSAGGYAKPDIKRHKRMYLARVLVGDYTTGRNGMITPPARGSGNAADLYDSVADNTAKPAIFVIFSDIQAYPEYLITFT